MEEIEDINRKKILTDFSKNILIEAGAGAGKTTLLINRILEQIKNTEISLKNIVAITFTEKAAINLQESFQKALFKENKDCVDQKEKNKLKTALENIDKIHISTIHSFCNSMLREMPFEAGLSLDFTIVTDDDEVQFKRKIFSDFCENDMSQELKEKLNEIDVNPQVLIDTFLNICEKDNTTWIYNDDIIKNESINYFMEAKGICDEIFSVLRETFTEEQINNLGINEEGETPVIKEETRTFYRKYKDYLNGKSSKISVDVINILIKLPKLMCSVSKENANNYNKELLEIGKEVNNIIRKPSEANSIRDRLDQLTKEYEIYKHAISIKFLIQAIEYFDEVKIKEKKITNRDLLVLARNMIKTSDTARKFFEKKYKMFYIDEFQDTDPVQTELIFYLTCKDKELTGNWEECNLKEGSLCIVGDPKQSIYSFTGADIKLYNRVKKKMQKDSNCMVYFLNRNYRSNLNICNWVENTFTKNVNLEFGFIKGSNGDNSECSESQAVFDGMTTLAPEETIENKKLKGIYRYDLGSGLKDELLQGDSKYIANMIKKLIDNKYEITIFNSKNETTERKQITYGDFLIITWYTKNMGIYINELKKLGIPVSVAGKVDTYSLEEVKNLSLLLEYLDENSNNYLLSLVLEKLFGCHINKEKRFNYNSIIWDKDKVESLPDEKIKKSLIYIRGLLQDIKNKSPMVVVESIVNNFKVIMGNKNYDKITINSAMGNVEQLLEIIRFETYSNFSDIASRLKFLCENIIDREMSITDLTDENGQYNAVRIMNLHKAKGLEGKIVILADPTIEASGKEDKCIILDEDGSKNGYVTVEKSNGINFRNSNIGKPASYDAAKKINDKYKKEENLRLLYVACTRAEEALIVSSGVRLKSNDNKMNNTAWKELAKVITCDKDTKELFEGLFDYEKYAKDNNCTTDEVNVGCKIIDEEQNFFEHKKIYEQKIARAKETRAEFINPSKLKYESSVIKSNGTNYEASKVNFKGNIYGIIVHKLFELLIKNNCYTRNITKEEMDIFIKKSILAGLENEELTKRQCTQLHLNEELVGISQIEQNKALYSALYENLKEKASEFINDSDMINFISNADAIYTELPFQFMVNKDISQETVDLLLPYLDKKDNNIYVSGVMDIVIKKGDEYVVIDYKTDIKSDGLTSDEFTEYVVNKHRSQLGLYEAALKLMIRDYIIVHTKIYTLYD